MFAPPADDVDITPPKRGEIEKRRLLWGRVGLAACKVKQHALAQEACRELSRLVKASERGAKDALDTLLKPTGRASLNALVDACGDQLHERANPP